MWDVDPDYKAWAKDKLEQARRLAQFGDVNQLAAEASDFRPGP
jgi:hypothetical protein